jgi:hypothetical protein
VKIDAQILFAQIKVRATGSVFCFSYSQTNKFCCNIHHELTRCQSLTGQTPRVWRGIQISARGVARQDSSNLFAKLRKDAVGLFHSPHEACNNVDHWSGITAMVSSVGTEMLKH